MRMDVENKRERVRVACGEFMKPRKSRKMRDKERKEYLIFCSESALPLCFVKGDSYGSRKVEAAGVFCHGDR